MVFAQTAVPGTPATLKVAVWRGRDDGAFAHYEVPRQASQTVLDVVTHIQRHLEPSLSYRFACRVGMCGSCAMTVNGVARWTCRTHVATRRRFGGTLEIAPLANLPVIKDLATDMAGFFDKWASAQGRFVGTRTRHDDFALFAPASPERVAAECRHRVHRLRASATPRATSSPGGPAFLGPAALNRAWTLVNDVRDGGQRERLRPSPATPAATPATPRAAARERCPKQIAPTAGIAGLKRARRPRRDAGHAVNDAGSAGTPLVPAAPERDGAGAVRARPPGGHDLRRARRPERRRDPRPHAGQLALRARSTPSSSSPARCTCRPGWPTSRSSGSAGATRPRSPLARAVRRADPRDRAARRLGGGGRAMRPRPRRARARAPGLVGLRRASPLRACCLALFLPLHFWVLGAGAARSRRLRRLDRARRPAALQVRRVGPRRPALDAPGGRRAPAPDRVRAVDGPAQELDRRRGRRSRWQPGWRSRSLWSHDAAPDRRPPCAFRGDSTMKATHTRDTSSSWPRPPHARCAWPFAGAGARAGGLADQAGAHGRAVLARRQHRRRRAHARPAAHRDRGASRWSSTTAPAPAATSAPTSSPRPPPDGYTLLMASGSITINPHIYAKMPFDTWKDLVPITNVASGPMLVVVPGQVALPSSLEGPDRRGQGQARRRSASARPASAARSTWPARTSPTPPASTCSTCPTRARRRPTPT